VCPPWFRVTPAEMQGGWVEVNYTNTAIKMAHKYAKKNLLKPECNPSVTVEYVD
jgi:hypothetical protein